MGTEQANLPGNPQDQGGQPQESQGQPAPSGSQPVDVELHDGRKVSIEELKRGYMMEADYRRKTAEIADERRRIDAERAELMRGRRGSQSLTEPGYDGDEEPNPIEILAKEVVSLKAAYARNLLTGEIDRLAAQYPEADKQAVFELCWANPNLPSVEDVMKRSHETVTSRVNQRVAQTAKPQTIDEFFRLNPDAKRQYDERLLAEYHAKKLGKREAATGTGQSASGGETFTEVTESPKTYSEATARLRESLKESTKEPI